MKIVLNVKKNWTHPVCNNEFIPMFDESVYHTVMRNIQPVIESYKNKPSSINCEIPKMPNIDNFIRTGNHIQLYFKDIKNYGEYTPLSPVFSNLNELKIWLCDNKDYSGQKWIEDDINDLNR